MNISHTSSLSSSSSASLAPLRVASTTVESSTAVVATSCILRASATSSSLLSHSIKEHSGIMIPILEGLCEGINPLAKRTEEDKKIKVYIRLASTFLDKLGWAQCYNGLLIKDAVQLHLTRLLCNLQSYSYLNDDGNCLFLYFMERLQSRPFHVKNRLSFKRFKEKLENHIKQQLQNSLKIQLESLLNQGPRNLKEMCLQAYLVEQTKPLKFHKTNKKAYEASIPAFAERLYLELSQSLKMKTQLDGLQFFCETDAFEGMKVGKLRVQNIGFKLEDEILSSFNPYQLIQVTSAHLPEFAHTICLILDRTLKTLLDAEILVPLKVICKRSSNTKTQLDYGFYSDFIQKIGSLKRIYKTQRKILNNQIQLLTNQLQKPTSRSLPLVEYQIKQIFTSLRLLQSQISRLSACTEKMLDQINLGIPEEDIKAISDSHNHYFLQDEEDQEDLKRSTNKMTGSLFEALKGGLLLKQTLADNKGELETALAAPKTLRACDGKEMVKGDLDEVEATTALDNITNLSDVAVDGVVEVISKLQELANVMKKFKDVVDRQVVDKKKQKKIFQGTIETLSRKKLIPSMDVIHDNLKLVSEQFHSFNYRFDVCRKSLELMKNFMDGYQELWLGHAPTGIESDIDCLWLDCNNQTLIVPKEIRNPIIVDVIVEDGKDEKRAKLERKREVASSVIANIT